MSDYAYPYDPTGSNPACLVEGEQHVLADYPNKWGCVIPLFAPFYRKDLTIRHVEEDRELHEGIDYYLGHYYKTASEENKMPIFGSVMIIDQTLSGTLEFTKYRTLGGRYNMLKRVIDVHLNQDDLADPRNLDWEDVICYEMAVPAVDAPDDRVEAIANDPITGGLDRIRKAIERLNDAKKTGFDDVIARLIVLGDKIHAHDVDQHEHRRGVHRITHTQLGALHKDAQAVDALKAYGYTLAELVTLVNLLGENAEDTQDLFRLIGDSLQGSLRFDGNNVIIQNVGGTSIINLNTGDIEILSSGDVTFRADDKSDDNGITAALRSGDNLLTLHSYVGDHKPAVIHNYDATFTERPHPTARQISSSPAFGATTGRVFAYKRIYFPGGDVTFGVMSDNSYELYVDGERLLSGPAYPNSVRNTINVSEGYHWVSVLCMNGSGPSFISFSFEKGGTVYSVSDETWWVNDVTGKTVADFVTDYPQKVDSSAVYNGFYLIHVGNIVDFLPPPDYVDTILHIDTTDTVFLTGRGIKTSPLTGYVFYPIATVTSNGVFKLNHSIFSESKKEAASINVVSKLKDFIDTKVDNTFEINGHRLNRSVTITASDLGLGNIDNTAPDEKVASDAFKAVTATKANAQHSHDPSDFNNPPIADATTLGLTKLTTTHSSREDVAATPVMLNDAYLSQLQTESNLKGKMPTAPFDIMQYGGFGYLPIPALGEYGAAGIGSGMIVGCLESDGRLVCLRNGADHKQKGVYYWYAEFRTDGQVDKVVPTSTVYRPNFIDDDDDVAYVIRGGEGVFTLATMKNKYYVVLSRNTMDMTKHVGVEITDRNGASLGTYTHTFLYKNEVHFHYTYFGNGGCYMRHWTCLVSDIENGNPITLTRRLPSGVDWAGETREPSDTFYFTTRGQDTDLDYTIPIILRKDNNKWTGSNNVRHSTQNSFASIKDNKVRVNVYGRTYYSNAYGATGYPLSHSYVIDLETLVAVSDNGDNFPITLSETGWSMANGSAPSEAWPAANPNSNSQPFESRGKMFVVRFYRMWTIPRLYTFEPSDASLSIYEYLRYDKTKYRTIAGMNVEGAYGSVVGAGTEHLGFLPGNRLISGQQDGRYVVCEYDTDGSYVDDGSGWGPTSNRLLMDNAVFWKMLRVPMNWETGKNEGFVLSSYVKSCPSKIESDVPTDDVSWSSGIIDTLLQEFRTLHPSEGEKSLFNDRVMLQAFGDWRTGLIGTFVQYTVIRWTDAEKTRRHTTTYTYTATLTFAGSAVASVTLGKLLKEVMWSSTTISAGSFESFGMNTCGKTPEGDTVFCLNHSLYVGYVGHSGGHIHQFVMDKDGECIFTRSGNAQRHIMYGTYWHPDLGFVNTSSTNYAQTVTATKYGKTTPEILANTTYGSVLIHATQVASGWIIYFTEDVRFFVNGSSEDLPVQNFDLSRLPEFPSYQNTTFYIYVVADYDELGVVSGRYVLSTSKTDDTNTSMYIGYAKTDDIQIIDLKVERATRLGSIYELEQHTQDPRAHNDITNLDKYSFSLGNVENMGMIHTLTLPTFREVFDSWKRISHLETTEAQPANTSELNSWQYNESNNSIICPINSATFVGFVSPGEVGDYVFDTLVGSPGADNDGLVIILAYKEDEDGKEHTLCATRSRSIEGHMKVNGKFDIWYNYKQSTRKLIATTGGTSNDGNWSGNYSRITAVRDGDQFTVTATKFVKSTNLIDHGTDKLEGVHTFNIIDHPELAMFKSGGSFGYGCISQPSSTFANILRPDEQVGNYYASADTIRILSEKQAESVKFATGLVAGGASIPIPAGFTAADCSVVLSFNTLTNAGKLTFAKAELVGMVCKITTRVLGGALATNAAGSNARYHLIARKRPEV